MSIMATTYHDTTETQYGIEYPNGIIKWLGYDLRTTNFDVRTKYGQEAMQREYEETLENHNLKQIPKLKFVKRIRTISFSPTETFEAE